jgi:hyperosmotically inducible periplasmic protein
MMKAILVMVLIVIFAVGCSRTEQISDSDVTSNVRRALDTMQGVDADRINVATSDGEVTLTGTVDSRTTRDRVVEIVGLIKGVRNVNNNLSVAAARPGAPATTAQPARPETQPGGQQQTQTEQEVSSALRQSDALSGVNINVRTQDGQVTLSGTVPNQASKELAERIARQQEGVRSVQNNIQVRPQQQQ